MTIYGSYVGKKTSGNITQRAWLDYSLSSDDGAYYVSASGGIFAWNTQWSSVDATCAMTGCSNKSRTCTSSSMTTDDKKKWWFFSGIGYSYPRYHYDYTASVTCSSKVTGVDSSSGGSSVNGIWSNATLSFTVYAKDSYTVSFNANGGSGAPSAQTKWKNETLWLPSTVPTRSGYRFVGWNSNASATTAEYSPSSAYTANSGTTLNAIWNKNQPTELDYTDLALTINGQSQTANTVIRGFTDISTTISDISTRDGATVTSIKLSVNGKESNTLTSAGTLTIPANSFTSADDGTHPVYIYTVDYKSADGSYAYGTYQVGEITIVPPTWNRTVVINKDKLPSLDTNGYAILDILEIKNYSTSPSTWDSVDKNGIVITDNGTSWSFIYVFDENHVDWTSLDMLSPTTSVRVNYKNYADEVPDGNKAFFTTSRNQNYSNGIYNVMFVGGVDNSLWTEYTSRVWWCKINNPLYFPDTNYLEVGSNDTQVQGLTKVGDYLAVVKQSKTTDTAIFLLYPTSFEEETTYAVKQGVQGVGALARYSFNILGDETLFLSPKGVMAIVPTQDEEHKVQNRSYFIDKKLLAEKEITDSYSFVYDGKYFLAVGNSVYVLDGNQRNSWGNDKTNLVYECYYLDNVPAKCFVKYDDSLVFSNKNEVCIFGNDYIDAYDTNSKEPFVPVKAKWSTIFDDDNALHYYKTMQKKGNLVSVLPLESATPYISVIVDEDTFDVDKTLYFTLVDGEYVRCDENSTYDQYETYYVENRTKTRVSVKKDGNAEVEIKRKFGLQSEIPSEMFTNKKFKKYKRLQFILRNEEAEDFGVDEIIKNYTVGNYAKK